METDTECCYRSSNAESVIAANSFWIEGVAVILVSGCEGQQQEKKNQIRRNRNFANFS